MNITLNVLPKDLRPKVVGYLAFNDLEPANATKYFYYKGYYFLVCKHNKDWCIVEFTTGLRVEYWHKTIQAAIDNAIEKINKYCPTEPELKALIDTNIRTQGLAPQAIHLNQLRPDSVSIDLLKANY